MTARMGVPKPQPPRDHDSFRLLRLCELSTGLALATSAVAAVHVDSYPAGQGLEADRTRGSVSLGVSGHAASGPQTAWDGAFRSRSRSRSRSAELQATPRLKRSALPEDRFPCAHPGSRPPSPPPRS